MKRTIPGDRQWQSGSYRPALLILCCLFMFALWAPLSAQQGSRIFDRSYKVQARVLNGELKLTSADANGNTSLAVWSSVWITPSGDTAALLQGQILEGGLPNGPPVLISSIDARPLAKKSNSLSVIACGTGFIVVWNDYRTNAPGIYARNVSLTGVVESEEERILDETGTSFGQRIGNIDSGRVIELNNSRYLTFDADRNVRQGPIVLPGAIAGYVSRGEGDSTLYVSLSGGYWREIDPVRSIVKEDSIPQNRMNGKYLFLPDGGIMVLTGSELLEYPSVYAQLPDRRVNVTAPSGIGMNLVDCYSRSPEGDYVLIYAIVPFIQWDPVGSHIEMSIGMIRVTSDDSVTKIPLWYDDFWAQTTNPLRERVVQRLCNNSWLYTWKFGTQVTPEWLRSSGRFVLDNGRVDSSQTAEPTRCPFSFATPPAVTFLRFDTISTIVVSAASGDTTHLSTSNETKISFDTIDTTPIRTRIHLYEVRGAVRATTGTVGSPVANPYTDGQRELYTNSIPIPAVPDKSGIHKTFIQKGPVGTIVQSCFYNKFRLTEGQAYNADSYKRSYTQWSDENDTYYSYRTYTIVSTDIGDLVKLDSWFDDVTGGWGKEGFDDGIALLRRSAVRMFEPNSRTLLLQYDYQRQGLRTAIFSTVDSSDFYFKSPRDSICCPALVPYDSRSYLGRSHGSSVVLVTSNGSVPYGNLKESPVATRYERLLGERFIRFGMPDKKHVYIELYNLQLDRIAQQTLDIDSAAPWRLIQNDYDSTLGLYVMEPDGIHATFFDKQLQILINDTLLLDNPGLLDFDVVNQGDTLVLAWTKVEGGYPDAFWTRFRLPTIGMSSVGTGSTGVERERTEDQIRVTDDLPGYAIRQQENVLLQVECVDPESCGDVRGLYDARGVMIAAPVVRWGTRTTVVDLTDVRSGAYYLVIEVGDRIVIRPVSVVR